MEFGVENKKFTEDIKIIFNSLKNKEIFLNNVSYVEM